ncbi:uncharacterized protein LOC135706511 isoform X2 [Ochlerotatus camptorhynchus]|uniref:uncharacterized protein LOC135706511 isoform X2 n=1 Tax=Ochlerotatus camptorhynchus TaxID=644619 RepID=UPI0031DC0D7F
MPEGNCSTLIEDSCNAPEWINQSYFESLLRKCKDDATIKVQSVQVKYALAKGENYASVIYRVQVVFYSKGQPARTRSYIIKGLSETELAKQKLGEYNVHGKEMDIYQLVIPELRQLMRSTGDSSDLYPNALCVDRNNDVMIFNDVSKKGFVMTDRTKGLDAIHTKISLKAMAKLHASSLKLVEMYPKIFDSYKTGMITRETDAFHDFFQSTYDALTDEIYTWDSEWHYYANKLRKLRPDFIEQGLSVFDNDSKDDLRVLVHDFQFCCYGTPAIDLCYFFFTSARDEIRQNGFEEYMQYYYYHLAEYVKRLNCTQKFPTLHQFQRQILKKMFYAIYSSVVALPIHLNEETADADFDALMAGDERSKRFKKVIMANKKYHKIIKGLLPTFDRKGLLDKLD